MAFQKGEVVESKLISRSVKQILVRPEIPFKWEMGQFIVSKLGDRIADYTIVSLPECDEFEILVEKYNKSIIGTMLHNLEIGESFTFKAPRGGYKLLNDRRKTIMISRDIGFTANLALLRQLAQNDFPISYYNFIRDDFDMPDLRSLFPSELDINLIEMEISGELLDGKMKAAQIRELFPEIRESDFYIAGASPFVKNMRSRLIRQGADKQRLVREFFG